jgi:hypothetical protein
LIVLTTNLLCIACLVIGIKIGQKTIKGEEIELPSLDPMKAIREHKERKKVDSEQNRFDAIMRNIDRYDGTSAGQEEIPR